MNAAMDSEMRSAEMMHKTHGRVKFFDTTKGYGFIHHVESGEDIFVHQSAIYARGFRSLLEAEVVEFEIREDPLKGKMYAANVTGPGGVPVQGQPRKPPGQGFHGQGGGFAQGGGGGFGGPGASFGGGGMNGGEGGSFGQGGQGGGGGFSNEGGRPWQSNGGSPGRGGGGGLGNLQVPNAGPGQAQGQGQGQGQGPNGGPGSPGGGAGGGGGYYNYPVYAQGIQAPHSTYGIQPGVQQQVFLPRQQQYQNFGVGQPSQRYY